MSSTKPLPQDRDLLRDRLARDVAAFRKSGGRITKVPIGVTGYDPRRQSEAKKQASIARAKAKAAEDEASK